MMNKQTRRYFIISGDVKAYPKYQQPLVRKLKRPYSKRFKRVKRILKDIPGIFQVMVEPLMRRYNYAEIGRELFQIQQIPTKDQAQVLYDRAEVPPR